MKRILSVLLLLLLSVPVYAASVQSEKLPDGAVGVWYVGATKTTSTLYKGGGTGDQRIVDREDSACWRPYGKGHAILDHADSVCGDGVWRVEEMQVGSIAELTVNGKRTYYQCTAIWLCTGTRYVYKYDGKTVGCKKGDIICVSCADDDGWSYVAYYKKC